LELSVADNGGGFEVETVLRKVDSFGLAGMRERVAQLGGVLDIQSRPGRGARVTARLPLPLPAGA
jgi:signal transduction histidine kinase